MECPACRTSNTSGTKYCIRCGRNLENFTEVNYGYGAYEEILPENKEFGESSYISGSLFSTEEINSTSEEFDFSGTTENDTPGNYDLISEEPLASQPYMDYSNGSVPLPAPPYKDMYGNSPQIIGYDQNGMPVYAQPSSYIQPSQIIGYDQNGMPVYAQPSSYIQPSQFIGYDQNGLPVYAQQSSYVQQPQIIGYDQNGMPVYSQPSVYPPDSVSVQNFSQNIPVNVSRGVPENDETAEKFMDFLDDGESEKSEKTEEDFFSKSSDMGSVEVPVPDVGSLKKRENKKKVYMADVELSDAKNLVPNNASKFNQKYMKQVQKSASDDLGEKKDHSRKVSMKNTKNVDAGMLNPKFSYKSRIRMGDASAAQADDFNTKTVKHRKFTMAEADTPVEAMPKKKKYVDELDLIELPEYMQARKKSKKDDTDFPSMTDL